MKSLWRGIAFVGTTGALLMLAAAAGCGDDDDDDNRSAETPTRGELNFEIQSATVPAPPGRPVVTFRVTDKNGDPIDLLAEMARSVVPAGQPPATATPRIGNVAFTLAQLSDDGNYTSYYETTAAGTGYIKPGETATTPAALPEGAKQATSDSVSTATAADKLVPQGDGVYRYELTAPPRTDLDRTKTHTIAMWGARTVLDPDGDPVQVPAKATLNFVPEGGGAVQRVSVIEDGKCNVCHARLQVHGTRTGVQLCITCHSPQTTDPQTGNTVDFKVMVHKIHRGGSLTNGPYEIVGFPGAGNPDPIPSTAVHDYSEVNFPNDISNCTVCHVSADEVPAAERANATRWASQASRAACLACHDNVRFEQTGSIPSCGRGVTAAECLHRAGPVASNTACNTCHSPGEVQQVHVNPLVAEREKFRYEIQNVSLDATRRPVVRFRVIDPTNNDAPYDIKADAPFVQPGGASSLNVVMGWPTQEITNDGTGQPYGQPISMNALTTATPVAGQNRVYDVTTSGDGGTVPDGVQNVTVFIEGHPATTTGERIPVTNVVRSVALGGGAAPARREVVNVTKCNACHGHLSAHGSNRNGTTESCVVCHNPNATDKRRRPAEVTGEESIDFKVMIHEIHAAGVRENEVTIYGFGNTPHTFPVGTGNVHNCAVCHVGNSYAPPLADGVGETTINTGADPISVGDNERRAPAVRAACQSCHDSANAILHMDQVATSTTRQCAECHGIGEPEADVSVRHPVVETSTTTQ
jgi:OmcA/MtrC family decaheme c-type cytochrome